MGENINIIGGENGSGKSTASKILYCFLTANSNERFEIATKSIYSEINNLYNILGRYFKNTEYSIEFNTLKSEFHNNHGNYENYEKIIKNFRKLEEIIKKNENEPSDLNDLLESINKSIKIITDDSDELISRSLKYLLNIEFSNADFNTDSYINFKDKTGKFNQTFKNNELKIDGFLDTRSVIYLDTLSILDNIYKDKLNTEHNPHHVNKIYSILKYNKDNVNFFDDVYNKKLIEIENEINNIIDGKFEYKSEIGDLIYLKNNKEYLMKSTSSGIKQLGIIQLLIKYRILKNNSFLIIDEPEVNLHPKWQVQLARILVILSKTLNITLFINSHSPLFIEAIEVYSANNNLLKEARFYLAKEESEGYCIDEILRKQLLILYDNLGKPYDIVDEIRGENIVKDLF